MKLWNFTIMAATLCAATASAQAQDRYEAERRDTQIRSDQTQRYSDQNRRADEDDSWSEWFDDWWNEDDQQSDRTYRSQTTRGASRDSIDRDARYQTNQRGSQTRTSQYGRDTGEYRDSQSQNESSQGVSRRGNIEQFFARYDENDDNAISRNELPQGMRSNFEQIDRDGNGRLSASELRQHSSRQQKLQQPVLLTYVWVVDANRGRMKLEDLQEAYSTLSEIDQDGNGKISRNELQARREQAVSKMVDKCFNNHDENDDDRLTRQEAEGTALAGQFGQFDENNDGKVSRSEVKRSLLEQLQQQSEQSDSSQRSGDSRESASRDSDQRN